MRLVCPNCDAEYEVDSSVIPDTGRDVQCSNCGHAWFQLAPEVEAELAAEEALFDAPPAQDPPRQADLQPPPAEAAAPSPAVDAPRRSLDDSVLAVLREEADRETAARRTETPSPIETQTEMGLAAASSAMDPTARRIAMMKGEDPDAGPPRPQTRREMLPEIEEINSTLRASSERRGGEAGSVADTLPTPPRRAGFRNGFVLGILIGALVLVSYIMAPKLSQQFPAAAPALKSFVGMIDAARLWVDGMMRSAIGIMQNETPPT